MSGKDFTSDDLKVLMRHDAFVRFVHMIHQRRESALGDVYNKETVNGVMRATGELRAYDDLLLFCNYEDLLKKLVNQV